MRTIAVLVAVLAAAAVTLRASSHARAAAGVPRLGDEEAAACVNELEVVLRRVALFEKEGLSDGEIARRNEPQLDALDGCRERFAAQRRRALDQERDLAEARRRAGPGATQQERDAALREVRLERLASRPASQLTPEERAELAAGMKGEQRARHVALDRAHARDPAFVRIVHSALTCFHGDRKVQLEEQIASEEALVKLGTGDRNHLYLLRSELRQSEDVLARTREASAGRWLEPCSSQTVALVAHCMGVQIQRKVVRGEADLERAVAAMAMCDSEEIQQYVRFVQ